ncbi:hypothetical protein [Aquitalea pelogenes]|uniref:hypothetical protein n=1 Tax=Aquitalea pelogenes TaxID=1293573 RepID=UPI0035AFD737
MIKERPIPFSAPMVRALLDGTKTQTRRVVKIHPSDDAFVLLDRGTGWWPYRSDDGESEVMNDGNERPYTCPYGQPGNRLWVRETCRAEELESGLDGVRYLADSHFRPINDTPGDAIQWMHMNAYGARDGANVPSIHMPRWASRILLEIVSVRVERLKEISEADADAEGCERLDSERTDRDMKLCPTCGGTGLHAVLGGNGGVIPDCDCRDCDTYVKRYKHLWEAINGPGSWDENPWVWVVEFKIVEEG